MILSVLLSATFTFNVTATGVEKGTAVEFIFAGPKTDRAYESMFVLDESVDSFCARLESSVPKGMPVDASTCRLWPTGCRIRFDPPLENFISIDLPEGSQRPVPIYTGGSRRKDGSPEAADTMPSAVFAAYSLAQSPIVYTEPFEQGAVYGRFTAVSTIEKGKRFTFSVVIDEMSLPRRLELTAEKGNLRELLQRLRTESNEGEIDVTISFSDALTLEEAVSVSQALSVVDSTRVKINGVKNIFYRAFLPLEKWRDRQERLHQPFELTLHDNGTDELLFIDEDWTVEGNDPKLTPRSITYDQATRHPNTDTCFVYASPTQTVSRIVHAMRQLSSSRVTNWYVFSSEIH